MGSTGESQKEKFICNTCEKTFMDRSGLARHTKNVHAPSIPCRYCYKKLKIMRADAYRTHLIRCKGFSDHLNTTNKDKIYEEAYTQSKILIGKAKHDRLF